MNRRLAMLSALGLTLTLVIVLLSWPAVAPDTSPTAAAIPPQQPQYPPEKRHALQQKAQVVEKAIAANNPRAIRVGVFDFAEELGGRADSMLRVRTVMQSEMKSSGRLWCWPAGPTWATRVAARPRWARRATTAAAPRSIYLASGDERFDATQLAFAAMGAVTVIPVAKPLKPLLGVLKPFVKGLKRSPASHHFAGPWARRSRPL